MCAAVVESAWEIAWLAGEFSGRSYVGLFYNFGDVLCFALVATAALAERDVSPAQDLERSLESSAHGFLPAVSARRRLSSCPRPWPLSASRLAV